MKLVQAGPSRSILEFAKKNISTERKIAELKIAAFICEHCSINTVDHLGTLIKALDSSSAILNDISLHRTKCVALILNVIAPCLLKKLLSDLGNNKYSLIIDESTAVDCSKMLCIMIRYFSRDSNKIITTFYRLLEIDAGDANTLALSIINSLKNDNIKTENLIGIGVDGANVMVGENHSLFTILKSLNKDLILIKCICHSLHLAAEHSFRVLPRNLDFIIKECHNWFSSSSKRQIQYKKLFESINDTTPTKIDKLSGTRWLARSNAIQKILDQWQELKLHFDMARNSERCYMADQLFSNLSDEKNYLYLLFLNLILKDLVATNRLFQSESADSLKLLQDLNLLMFGYLKVLIPSDQLEKIPKTDIITFNFSDHVMDAEFMFFGYEFNKHASESKIPKADLKVIKQRCKDFIFEICKQIQKRIPDNINILQNINLLTPEFATSQVRQPDITALVTSFPSLADHNVDAVLSEWKMLPLLSWSKANFSTEEFWIEVSHSKNAVDELRFPNISKFALSLLVLPFSNAEVERAFSTVNILKNKLRNRMLIPTLDSIMRVRFSLKNSGCTNFNPTEDMLKSFNSENMYKCKNDDDLEAINLFFDDNL